LSYREPLLGQADIGVGVRDDAAPVLALKELTIDFAFTDLGLKLKDGKAVLKGVTGEIKYV
jgi:hypothetical protein